MPQMDAGFSQPEREFRRQQAAMEATWTAERRPAPASPPLPAAARAAAGAGAWAGVRPRLAGPGGYYNVGNALGLVGGLALAVVQASGAEGPTLGSGARVAYDHLAGSASALSVTAAMLVFFWSGEVYLRAWARGFPPDARLNRRGDLLSGWCAAARARPVPDRPTVPRRHGWTAARYRQVRQCPARAAPASARAAGPVPDRGAAQPGSGAGDAGRRAGLGVFGAGVVRWRPRWRRRRC